MGRSRSDRAAKPSGDAQVSGHYRAIGRLAPASVPDHGQSAWGRPFGSLPCHTTRHASPHRPVQEVEVMREGQSEPVRPFRVNTALRSMPLLHYQRRQLAASCRATSRLAPSASSSLYIVVPHFHCLSWIARSRSRSHWSSSRQTFGVCASRKYAFQPRTLGRR